MGTPRVRRAAVEDAASDAVPSAPGVILSDAANGSSTRPGREPFAGNEHGGLPPVETGAIHSTIVRGGGDQPGTPPIANASWIECGLLTSGGEMPVPNSLDNPSGRSAAWHGLRALVVGLGRFGGGVGVTRWLAAQGARITVTDRASAESLRTSLDAIADLDVTFRLGGHDGIDLDDVDIVVLNPAVVKRTSKLFRAIAQRGISWTTELNLFCERCPASMVAVTGSFGKSTTCAMLAAALNACRRTGNAAYTRVLLGGNIGGSLLADLPTLQPTDLVVLEMSSAQLEDVPRIAWTPHIAAITNIHPHHLDRHATFERYVEAKLNVLGNPPRPSALVLGDLDPIAASMLDHRRQEAAIPVTCVGSTEPRLDLTVAGIHDQANAAIALAICRLLNCDEQRAVAAIEAFPGLPHRLQYLGEIESVHYWNDSKSTAPEGAVRAVEAIGSPIVLLAGGQDKGADLRLWAQVVGGACRYVVCFGEAGAAFARAASEASVLPRAAVDVVPSLSDAVRVARRIANAGDAVVLSPGAPSFDEYVNFVARGEHFQTLVGWSNDR